MKTLLLTLSIRVNQTTYFFSLAARKESNKYFYPSPHIKETMQAHLTILKVCNPHLSHDKVRLEIQQFDASEEEKEKMVKDIFGYDPMPKAYFYDPPEATKCLYPLCIGESCYLLPFRPPTAVTYKTMMHALGTLPAQQREALRKALRLIENCQHDPYPRYPKNLSIKLKRLLPKVFVGDVQLHYEETVVCHSDDMDELTNMDDYFNVYFECFRKKRLMWWRTLFDINIMAEKHFELLGAGAVIIGEQYNCKPLVHEEYGHMMLEQGKVVYSSYHSFRPGAALICLFSEGGKPWNAKQVRSKFTKQDREELKKPLLAKERTFVYQMQTEFIPFCQIEYGKVLGSMEALNASIENGTLELRQDCIREDASEALISHGTYQITEVDVLKQIVSLYGMLL